MSELPNFEAMVERFAVAAERAPARRRLRWLALPAAGAAVVATGVAIAATGGSKVDIGHPVVAPKHPAIVLGTGSQAVDPKSIRVLSARAADPDGGPPWAVRSMRTVDGLLCAQVGRVSGGRFGVIGFDGKLHELPARIDVSTACAPRRVASWLASEFERTGAVVPGLGTASPVSSVKLNRNAMSSDKGCDDAVTSRTRGRPLVLCDQSRLRLLAWGVLEPGVDVLIKNGQRTQPQADRSYVYVDRVSDSQTPVTAEIGGDRFRLVPRQSAVRTPTGLPDLPSLARTDAAVTPASGGPATNFALRWTVPHDARHRGDGWTYYLQGPGGATCRARLSATLYESAGGLVKKGGPVVDGEQRIKRKLRPQNGIRRGQRVLRTLAPPGPQPNGWCPGDYSGEIRFGYKEVVASFRFSVR